MGPEWQRTWCRSVYGQQKFLRFLRNAVDGGFHSVSRTPPAIDGDDTDGSIRGADIETLRRCTESGDLVRFLGVTWSREREDGLDLLHPPVETTYLTFVRFFSRTMRRAVSSQSCR